MQSTFTRKALEHARRIDGNRPELARPSLPLNGLNIQKGTHVLNPSGFVTYLHGKHFLEDEAWDYERTLLQGPFHLIKEVYVNGRREIVHVSGQRKTNEFHIFRYWTI